MTILVRPLLNWQTKKETQSRLPYRIYEYIFINDSGATDVNGLNASVECSPPGFAGFTEDEI